MNHIIQNKETSNTVASLPELVSDKPIEETKTSESPPETKTENDILINISNKSNDGETVVAKCAELTKNSPTSDELLITCCGYILSIILAIFCIIPFVMEWIATLVILATTDVKFVRKPVVSQLFLSKFHTLRNLERSVQPPRHQPACCGYDKNDILYLRMINEIMSNDLTYGLNDKYEYWLFVLIGSLHGTFITIVLLVFGILYVTRLYFIIARILNFPIALFGISSCYVWTSYFGKLEVVRENITTKMVVHILFIDYVKANQIIKSDDMQSYEISAVFYALGFPIALMMVLIHMLLRLIVFPLKLCVRKSDSVVNSDKVLE